MDYRVWVIGLDGATFDLISPWVKAGYLPTFKRIMNEGTWGDVQSTIPPITGPAWSTFMTGTNPGKHGIFDWTYRQSGSYDFLPVTGEHCRQPSLWQVASQAGKRMLVLNVPMTYPPEPINGLLVSGLPSTKLTTYPEELADNIHTLIPNYIVYPDPGQAYSDQGIKSFLVRVENAIEGRLELWHELITREKWDFSMILFNATDVVQHAMWKFMSPEHHQHDPDKFEEFGNSILKVYQRFDQALNNIIAEMDSETVLMVMSDHGFGPFYKFIHVNTWLVREDLLSLRPSFVTRIKSTLFKLGFSPMAIYNILMGIGLGKLKREVVRGKSQKLRTLFLSFDDVKWDNTIAYSFGNIGQIRINVRGREPNGCVNPGDDYNQVANDIINRLSKLKDPKTGELVIDKIYLNSEVYSGEAAEDGADILFLPRRLEYFGFGEYEFGDHRVVAPVNRGISGTHRMNGIGMVWGKPIIPGKFQDASLEDLAPTILYLMGVPIPEHMDGRPLMESLRGDAKKQPPKFQPAWESRYDPKGELSSEEEKKIRQRLRDLGYVS